MGALMGGEKIVAKARLASDLMSGLFKAIESREDLIMLLDLYKMLDDEDTNDYC